MSDKDEATRRRPSYSMRMGRNPDLNGFPLSKIKTIFVGVFEELNESGFFQEGFGYYCVDAGEVFYVYLATIHLVVRKIEQSKVF